MEVGSSSSKAWGETTLVIPKGPSLRLSIFRLGRRVIMFFALSHTRSPTLKLGAGERRVSAVSWYLDCARAISFRRCSVISAICLANAVGSEEREGDV